jgi:hypothetical protein
MVISSQPAWFRRVSNRTRFGASNAFRGAFDQDRPVVGCQEGRRRQ